jgi:hypothetical protein
VLDSRLTIAGAHIESGVFSNESHTNPGTPD